MKKLLKYLPLLALPLFLTACAKQEMVFGMPVDQWSKLTNDQQKVVIESYYKAQGGYQANN